MQAKKNQLSLALFFVNVITDKAGDGGVDGTRTRDPRRDRPVF